MKNGLIKKIKTKEVLEDESLLRAKIVNEMINLKLHRTKNTNIVSKLKKDLAKLLTRKKEASFNSK